MRHFIARTLTLAGRSTPPQDQRARGDAARAVGASHITTPEYSDGGSRAPQAVGRPHAEPARAQGSATRIAGSGVLVRVARTVEQVESFRACLDGDGGRRGPDRPGLLPVVARRWRPRSSDRTCWRSIATGAPSRSSSPACPRSACPASSVTRPCTRRSSARSRVVREGLLGRRGRRRRRRRPRRALRRPRAGASGRRALPPAAARVAPPRRGAGAGGLPDATADRADRPALADRAAGDVRRVPRVALVRDAQGHPAHRGAGGEGVRRPPLDPPLPGRRRPRRVSSRRRVGRGADVPAQPRRRASSTTSASALGHGC